MEKQMHSPSTNEIFEAISDGHRRQLLVSLLDHNPQSVPQVSGASRDLYQMSSGLLEEFLTDTPDIDEADEESIRLHHNHLPKLADYGFIEWDRDENEVHKGPKFDQIRPLLVLLEENRETLPHDWL